jgi:hypothetical protein
VILDSSPLPSGEVALKGRVRADVENAERMKNEKQAMQNEKQLI